MSSVFSYNCVSRSILFVIFLTFSFTYCLPLRAGWTDIIGVSPEVKSLAKIKKLADKMKKLEGTGDKHKIYKTMLSIKKEAEKLSGHKISLSTSLDAVESQVNKHGTKVHHSYFKAIKKEIEGEKHKDNDSVEEDGKLEAPVELVFGVTLALCGLFLMVLPFPFCKQWGDWAFKSGVLIAGRKLAVTADENKKNEKEKNRKYIYRYS